MPTPEIGIETACAARDTVPTKVSCMQYPFSVASRHRALLALSAQGGGAENGGAGKWGWMNDAGRLLSKNTCRALRQRMRRLTPCLKDCGWTG
jgi:hypothetical protein